MADWSAESILSYCRLPHPAYRIEAERSVTSTNNILKERGQAGEEAGLILCALEQTAGRGRVGRSFYSPEGTGVYFTLLLKPQTPAAETMTLTTAAAVATARAIDRVSALTTGIKWVNDIYLNGRKVVGILTEAALGQNVSAGQNSAAGQKASAEEAKAETALYWDYCVIGIGINLFEPEEGFPDEIKDIAGSVFGKKSEYKEPSEGFAEEIPSRIMAAFLDEWDSIYDAAFGEGALITADEMAKDMTEAVTEAERNSLLKEAERPGVKRFMEIYREKSILTGCYVNLFRPDHTPIETAGAVRVVGLGDLGELIVEDSNGQRTALNQGEVSVRPAE